MLIACIPAWVQTAFIGIGLLIIFCATMTGFAVWFGFLDSHKSDPPQASLIAADEEADRI